MLGLIVLLKILCNFSTTNLYWRYSYKNISKYNELSKTSLNTDEGLKQFQL